MPSSPASSHTAHPSAAAAGTQPARRPHEAGAAALPTHSDAAAISVCIVCRNEADRLEPCLQSAGWADEIVVLDLGSTDGSIALAKRYGAKVVSRPPVPIVELVRNEAAAAARGDWILVLDPDERVTPGLAAELRRLAADDDLHAVVMPRTNYDLGYAPAAPLHRYEPQLRMYRRSRVDWPVVPNAWPVVPDRHVRRIDRRDDLVLVHDRSRNIPEVLDRAMRYAPLQAQAMIDRGEMFTARRFLAAMSRHASRQFIQGRAFRDGVPGVLRATLLVSFHFYIWAAFWQLSGARRTAADDRLLRRVGFGVAVVRRLARAIGAPYALAQRLRARIYLSAPSSSRRRTRP